MVEDELVVALVLWLLAVIRVLLHVLHVVHGELNNEVDDVILTKKVQVDEGFLLDEKIGGRHRCRCPSLNGPGTCRCVHRTECVDICRDGCYWYGHRNCGR